jgi:hypothetical protein
MGDIRRLGDRVGVIQMMLAGDLSDATPRSVEGNAFEVVGGVFLGLDEHHPVA